MSWSPVRKLAFRFLASYLLIFILSNQFVLSFALDAVWQMVTPWFAEQVLGLTDPVTVFTNGSGDTTYNFVSTLLYLLAAVLATSLWTLLDYRRSHYRRLWELLFVLVRYYVCFQMLVYGLAKVFCLQFPAPGFSRLVQPFGEASPMGLLWTFMGYSAGYSMFTGAAELLGALLLLSRRTTTLGALVVFGVMANVMMLNFCYDVPVKLLSTHLVLMSLLLIAPNATRLFNFLIANRPVRAADIPPFFSNPRLEKIKNIVKWSLVALALTGGGVYMLSMLQQYGPAARRPPLYGLYEVERFQRNGVEVPPLATDSTRWKRLIVESKSRALVHMMDDQDMGLDFRADTVQRMVYCFRDEDSPFRDTLLYSLPDSNSLELRGRLRGDSLQITFKRKRREDFPLMSRGFRWVNERPYNR